MIIHASINFKGGVGTVIKNLISYQIKNEYRIGILYIDKSEQELSFLGEIMEEIELIKCKRLNLKGLNTLLGMPIKRTYIQLREKYPNYNIIFHAHNPVVVGILSDVKMVPLVCTIHGINTSKTIGSQLLTKKILNKLFNENKTLVAVSNHTAEYYFKDKLQHENIRIIKNGLEINRGKHTDNKSDIFNIGYVSYIDSLKGWKYLLEAFILLFKDYGNKVHLIIAGDGPLQEINELRRIIQDNNLSNVVHYYGYINDAGNEIYPLLDVFVLPSQSEGMPMTVLEALANRVPVLATPVGGIPEVITNGYNGFFIKRDSKDIYEKLKMLIDNRNMYDYIKSNTYISYEKEFTAQRMGQEYDKIYRRLLEENGNA